TNAERQRRYMEKLRSRAEVTEEKAREIAQEKIKELAADLAKERAHDQAHEHAHDVAKEASDEAYKEAYDEAYKEACVEAYAFSPESGHGFRFARHLVMTPKAPRIAASDESEVCYSRRLCGNSTMAARITLFGLFSARPSRD
ncbi:MAG: hypothetical protein WBY67_05385, partial [Pseudolabrys sp.]